MFSLEKHMEEGSPLEWLSLFGLQLGGKCMTIDNIKKKEGLDIELVLYVQV